MVLALAVFAVALIAMPAVTVFAHSADPATTPIFQTEQAGTERGMTRSPAPIEQVNVLVQRADPPRYVLDVQYGLPNGCARSGGYQVNKWGQTIEVKVWNLYPSDPNTFCSMIYTTGEYSISLGSNFEAGATYTVFVNDTETAFTAQ